MGSDDERIRFVTAVAAAYNNAAVEYEFAQDFSNSLIYYNKAVRISQIHLGKLSSKTKNFEANFEDAKDRVRNDPSIQNNRKKITDKNLISGN